MMRYKMVHNDRAVAQFAGYRDAVEYYSTQMNYPKLSIVPINGAEIPETSDEIFSFVKEIINVPRA